MRFHELGLGLLSVVLILLQQKKRPKPPKPPTRYSFTGTGGSGAFFAFKGRSRKTQQQSSGRLRFRRRSLLGRRNRFRMQLLRARAPLADAPRSLRPYATSTLFERARPHSGERPHNRLPRIQGRRRRVLRTLVLACGRSPVWAVAVCCGHRDERSRRPIGDCRQMHVWKGAWRGRHLSGCATDAVRHLALVS